MYDKRNLRAVSRAKQSCASLSGEIAKFEAKDFKYIESPPFIFYIEFFKQINESFNIEKKIIATSQRNCKNFYTII